MAGLHLDPHEERAVQFGRMLETDVDGKNSPPLRDQRRLLRSPGSLALLTLLAIFTWLSTPPKAFATSSELSDGLELKSCPDPQHLAAPLLAPSFISTSFAPLRPCLPGAMDASPQSLASCFVRPSPTSGLECQANLVSALILEKYRRFRESLTSP